MAQHKQLRRKVRNTVALITACVLICGIAFAGAVILLRENRHLTASGAPSSSPLRQAPTAVLAPGAKKPVKPVASGYACQGYSGLQKYVPLPMMLNDTFAWGNNAAYKVGNGAGDIKWESDPYNDPSWHLWVHSLRWLGNGIDAMRAGNVKARTHTLAIIQDWVKDNPFPWRGDASASESTMHRTNVLICARQALLTSLHARTLPAQYQWLDDALLTHAQYMIDHWSGSRNHGTDESIALFGVGCTFGRQDLMTKARDRLNSAVVQSIDAEGTTNEQSVGYAGFNYRLWGRAAAVVRRCGVDPGPAIEARRKLLADWMALATKPNGELFQIGNTTQEKVHSEPGTPWEFVATQGKSGPRPVRRTGIFKGGYIFGRTGWGEQRAFGAESAYSIRFGPAALYHGHDDHTSINYNWHGQDILIDPGYYGYKKGDLQDWAPSQAAHNVMTIPTAQSKKVPTRLVGSTSTSNSDYYELADQPAEGVNRARDLLVLKDPDVVVALDRGVSSSEQRYETLWHLPPGQNVTVQSPTTAVATGGKVQTHLFQIPFGDMSGTTTVEQGKSNPAQGWYLPDIFHTKPAPVVKFTQTGQNARILSVIAPAAPGEQVSYTTRSAGTNFFVDLTVGAAKVTIKVTPDGRLTRMN